MSNSSYWQKRMMILEEASHKDAKACLREVLTAFTHSRIQLNSEIEKWISRIAANNELSMTEARKLLKGDELEEFRWNVEQYIEHGRANEIDHAWEKQLENASAKVHVSRWEAMNLSMEEYLREAFGKEEDLLTKLLEGTAKDRYTRTAYEIEKGLNLGRAINVPATDIIIKNPWATDERIFSDRIWTHMTEMKAELQDALLQQVLTGAAPDEAIKRMQQYVAEGVDNAKRRASTLVMTETAAIGNKAQMQCYKDLDVEELEIVATLDSITCKKCGSRDGLRYPESEMKIGLNAPPFHANCRCCTAPYIEGFEPSQRMMRNPETGRSEYVENMTYEEWADRYLNNDKTISSAINDGPIKRNTAAGDPSAITHVGAPPNNRQKRLLASLQKTDDRATVHKKSVNMKDLAAMTAETGDEFAMFTKGGERLIIRGDNTSVYINEDEARKMAAKGYRFSGHTHPTTDPLDLLASDGDRNVLKAFGMERSVIYNPAGQYNVYEAE